MEGKAYFLSSRLGAFTTNAAGQLDVLWHDGDTLGVDGTQVGIFEKTNQVGLGSLLKSHNGRGLETEVSFEVLSNLTYKSLERQLADEQLGALLVPTDLTESYGSRPVPVWLFDSSCCRSQLPPGSLGCQLSAWGLLPCHHPPVDLRAVCFVRGAIKRSLYETTMH